MNLTSLVVIALLGTHQLARGEDWDKVAIPVRPPSGMEWKLQAVSDDFNYSAKPTEKPKQFSDRWHSAYINPWKGPGKTEWNLGHSYVMNGHLGIHASRKDGSPKVYTGIVTSKEAYRYPLFVETRVKISNQVLASNVWMLSADSTEEIDVVEAYGSDRPGQEWYSERVHLSHHVFVREPFQDYQPTDEGSWFTDGTIWRNSFHRFGVYWRDPWHLAYYIDGRLVRTVSKKESIDPMGFTGGKGLTKDMHIIINMEDQSWRSDEGITPTDEELADTSKGIMWVDWIRVYKAVEGDRAPTPSKQQNGARQPATAADSKSEGNEKPKPESEERSE